jgi:hypothetical protein
MIEFKNIQYIYGRFFCVVILKGVLIKVVFIQVIRTLKSNLTQKNLPYKYIYNY